MLIRQQKNLCHYCRRRMDPPGSGSQLEATVDHMTPKAKQGWRGMSNLCAACRTCNQSKGDLTAEEFFAVLTEFRRDEA